jgi:methionyl-tRNA formyltransferase
MKDSVVFMGTPEFACVSLERLVREGFAVRAVITQPDRPHGRGNRIATSPAKDCALRLGIPVLQPERIDESTISAVRDLNPDFLVTVAFGQILRENALCLPCRICACGDKRACVNVHASLLPEYRGANPIQQAILDGRAETGVTTMLMEPGMDTGPALLQQKTPILDDDTFGSLHARLAEAGADLLVRTLREFDTITPRPQDHSRATYTSKITREFGIMDWSRDAAALHNHVRGCNPWPVASTDMRGERILIWKSEPLDESVPAGPGAVLSADASGIIAATGRGALRILELQRQGKKRLPCGPFLLGFPIAPGDKFESRRRSS